jgi:hypothetical protein
VNRPDAAGIEAGVVFPLRRRADVDLGERLEKLGRELGERESEHAEGLAEAHGRADELRAQVADAIGRFHAAARKAGAPNLAPEVSPVRADDKHVRSCEFELVRGRHRAIVTVKSRGEITLVGPFRAGKAEGPCRSFPLEKSDEFEAALADFLSAFVEDAATP